MELVILNWLDSATQLHWSDEGLGLTEIQSVGWVLNEDDVQIQLAQNRYDDGEVYCNIISIPKTTVTNRVALPFEETSIYPKGHYYFDNKKRARCLYCQTPEDNLEGYLCCEDMREALRELKPDHKLLEGE